MYQKVELLDHIFEKGVKNTKRERTISSTSDVRYLERRDKMELYKNVHLKL